MLHAYSRTKVELCNNSELHIEVHRDWKSSNLSSVDWNNLLTKSIFPSVFLSWEWVSTWWRWFGGEGCLRLIVASKYDEPLAILPAYISRTTVIPGFTIPVLRIVGDGGPVCSDYLGPIIKQGIDDHSILEIIKAIRGISEDWQYFKLSSILPKALDVSIFMNALNQDFSVDVKSGEICPFIELPSHFDDFLNNLSTKRRKRLAYEIRRASKRHTVRVVCHTSPQTLDEAFEIVSAVFKKSDRGQNGVQGFSRNDYLGFHRDIARLFAERGWLRIFTLFFDDSPVAFLYGFLFAGTFWFYQTSYDLNYNELSPGSIILQMAIESVIKEGAKEFDFLRGDESYKFHFTRTKRCTKNLFVFRKHSPLFQCKLIYNRIKHVISTIGLA